MIPTAMSQIWDSEKWDTVGDWLFGRAEQSVGSVRECRRQRMRGQPHSSTP